MPKILRRFRWWAYNNYGELLGFVMAVAALLIAGAYANGCTKAYGQTFHALRPSVPRDRAIPSIQFVGDDIAQGLVEAANIPTWQCTDCKPSATSTMALSGFSSALETHPDVIVFLLGTYDLVPVTGQPSWQIACGYMSVTCNNLTAMISQAFAAHVQVIVGTIPPWGEGPLATTLDPDTVVAGLVPKWNQHIVNSYGSSTLSPPGTSVPFLIDFDSALAQQTQETDSGPAINGPYIASYTNNGVDPNSAGYAIMVQLVKKQLGTMRFIVK